jgi:hypothetical protein
MCSYQRLNNSHGCANSKSLNGLLKTELGFEGFVVSDWFAQHVGVATANVGLDMAMPNAGGFWGGNLIAAINNGSVAVSRLDDMTTRCVFPANLSLLYNCLLSQVNILHSCSRDTKELLANSILVLSRLGTKWARIKATPPVVLVCPLASWILIPLSMLAKSP